MKDDALAVPAERLGKGAGIPLEVVGDVEALARHFASTMVAEYRAARDRAKPYVVFIAWSAHCGLGLTGRWRNIDRIPRAAVTVGMKEILGARKIRLYMNRSWQCAIVRKPLYGPITAAVPASLVRDRRDVALTIPIAVTQLPEPILR